MGPLGFLTGVVLGSAVSIAGVLAMVLIVFLAVSSDHPALLEEYAPLLRGIVLFGILAAVGGVAFVEPAEESSLALGCPGGDVGHACRHRLVVLALDLDLII